MFKKTNIFYIANMRLPTEKAHGIQIMEMCSAFTKEGATVELVVARRFNHIHEDPFVYHDIKKTFIVRKIFCIDLARFGKWGYLVEMFSFTIGVALYALFQKDATFYTRDELLALTLSVLGKKVAWEGHMGQTNFIIQQLIKRKVRMVMITQSLRELYLSLGVDVQNITVAPDGVDVQRFDVELSREDARKQLNLSPDKNIVLYKGALFAWKGAGDIARAATQFDEHTQFVFIGGTKEDVDAFRKEFAHQKNVSILGNRPRTETPIYQKAADVLVIPNSGKNEISKLYTSPMKLFGYMAGGVPIVASDLPSIREVLNEHNAVLVKADSPDSFAEGIRLLLADKSHGERLAQQALVDVQSYTWEERAKKILAFIR